MTYFNPII